MRKQQQGERQASLRVDPSAWVESASGHYAFVAHVDACFGLERENADGDELIIFAGVARNTAPRTLLLDEDRPCVSGLRKALMSRGFHSQGAGLLARHSKPRGVFLQRRDKDSTDDQPKSRRIHAPQSH
jgi:hypothetical protein